MKQLSRDTSLAIHQTCCGFVELAQHLLATTHSYVCLGKFSSDALEKVFGKLRQGSGGTYFISVQQVLEKLNIQKTSLLLGLGDTNELPESFGHECDRCGFETNERVAKVIDRNWRTQLLWTQKCRSYIFLVMLREMILLHQT